MVIFRSLDISEVSLGKTRLRCGHITPLLDNGLLDLPGVGPGPSAHLLGHVHTLLGGLKLGHQLGHMLARSLWVEGARLFRLVTDHSLGLLVALLHALDKATASRATELHGDLGALGERGVLGRRLLRQRALLSWPAAALGARRVPGSQ